jgi:hypothetical protein
LATLFTILPIMLTRVSRFRICLQRNMFSRQRCRPSSTDNGASGTTATYSERVGYTTIAPTGGLTSMARQRPGPSGGKRLWGPPSKVE